jgi:hypothetical protein
VTDPRHAITLRMTKELSNRFMRYLRWRERVTGLRPAKQQICEELVRYALDRWSKTLQGKTNDPADQQGPGMPRL